MLPVCKNNQISASSTKYLLTVMAQYLPFGEQDRYFMICTNWEHGQKFAKTYSQV